MEGHYILIGYFFLFSSDALLGDQRTELNRTLPAASSEVGQIWKGRPKLGSLLPKCGAQK